MSTNLSEKRRSKMLETLTNLRTVLQDNPETCNMLMEIENELNKKKYGLIWEEHEEFVDEELKTKIPVFVEDKTLEIKCDEKDSYNFLIEGDNLHSLYLLEKTHKNKIDVIYIDPPYNTGNSDFKYDDSFIEREDSFKHSKWLSFISKRLRIAKNLLSNKGLIFISIDENEFSQLKILCDDIFGENNYISTLHWKKKKQPSYLHGQVAGVMEYILIYSRNRMKIDKLSLSTPTDSNTRVDNASNQISERIIRKGIHVKLAEKNMVIKAGVYKNKTMETEYLDDVIIKDSITQNEFRAKAKFRDSQERIDKFCEEGVLFITKNYGFRRDKLSEELNKKKAITDLLLDWGDNQDSDKEIKDIFKEKIFSYPKPALLIKNIIKSTGYSNAIILDFFAGSGTTGHAVLDLNKEDGGNRRFILCTNNENNICRDITYKRLRTVITGIRSDNSVYSDGISSNLKYYRTEYINRFNKENENYYIVNELSSYIKELVQLEQGIDITNTRVQVIFDDDDADEILFNEELIKKCKIIYLDRNVMLTNEQQDIIFENKISICEIPEYYFENEIMEVEGW